MTVSEFNIIYNSFTEKNCDFLSFLIESKSYGNLKTVIEIAPETELRFSILNQIYQKNKKRVGSSTLLTGQLQQFELFISQIKALI